MKAKAIGKRRIAGRAKKLAGKMKAAHIAGTGVTSRVYGHVSARGRRAQGRRDSQQRAASRGSS